MSKLQTPDIEAPDLRTCDRDGPEVPRGGSFAVGPGTIFDYLGRNGAGKSTAVRTLAALTLPSSGSVLVEGVDADSDLNALAAGIAFTLAIAAPTLATPARKSSRMSSAA